MATPAFGAAFRYDTGADPHGLAAADVDGDLDVDLAVADTRADTVTVLINDCRSIACAADLDRDGEVGFDDLLALLDAWGPCDDACNADFTGDGFVDFADLLVVLSAWGPCA